MSTQPHPGGSLFLSDEELRTLTGYDTWGWQRKWLKSQGWKFEVSARGRPNVLTEYARERMSDQLVKEIRRRPVLNLAAIK